MLPSEETPARSASLDDLELLEGACAGSRPLDLRDRAILRILVTTAARNSSVRRLRVEDIDFERNLIRFRRAKGAKTLEIVLHPSARTAVCDYLDRARPRLVSRDGDEGWLFPSSADSRRPLTMNALSVMLTRRYHSAGGTLSFFGSHRIRHGTATMLVNTGMPLEEVSRYLGHASTDVTRRYARHTPETLGAQAADALARAGITSP